MSSRTSSGKKWTRKVTNNKANSESFCIGKLSNGKLCQKIVKGKSKYCRWHDPEDTSWREVYAELRSASKDRKTDIILELVNDHPENILVLPIRDGVSAWLTNVDLTPEVILKKSSPESQKKNILRAHGMILSRANLLGVNLEGANLSGAHLVDANVQEALIANANLKKTAFVMANLQGTSFNDSNLEEAKLTKANLKKAHLVKSNLQSANLIGAQLQEANFSGADLQGADLREANLQGAILFKANFQNSDLSWAKLQGVNFLGVHSLLNVRFFRAWLSETRMAKEQLGKQIVEERERNYTAAKQTYLALKQNFESLGDYEASSWAYCKERRMEKLEALGNGDFMKFISDSIVELLCNYGESFWRVVGWMAFLLFLVGPLMFSGIGGIDWSKSPPLAHEYISSSGLSRFLLWYRVYFLYTLDTFTTASFSGLQPINDVVKIVSGFFAIVGIFLAGLLGFVAGNRIRRS